MATIVLTALSQVHPYKHQYEQASIATMTMQAKMGIENLAFLAPTKPMVMGHKRYADPKDIRWAGWIMVSDQEYIDQYRVIIERNMPHIKKWYSELDHDVILCCYCKPGDFCHRHFVYKTFEWLNGKGIGGHTLVKDW